MIIWAEIWCWTWSECGCGRVVYCHECKCWLTLREGNVLVLLELFFWHDCETGTSEASYWISTGKSWVYPCNLCEYKATTQGILKTHNESVHENVQYTCNLCEYKRKQQFAFPKSEDSKFAPTPIGPPSLIVRLPVLGAWPQPCTHTSPVDGPNRAEPNWIRAQILIFNGVWEFIKA